MKKFFCFISIVLIILCCLSSVNALSCQRFSIDLPDGFEETDGWGSSAEHINDIHAGNGIPFNGKVHRWLEIKEMGTSEEYKDFDYSNVFESEYLLDDYSEGNLYVCKFNIPNFDNGIVKENFTYAHFDKDGYHYEMYISYNGNINNLKLSDDVAMVKELRDSLKHRK